MALNPGDMLLNGHYRIEHLLGRGGFGFVYQARDTLLSEAVAIKELIPALVGDEATLKRFLAEARATMRLTHRHIVRTHNVFQEGDNYYIVMEHMAGGSLEQRLREGGTLSVDEAVRAAAEVCAGLACAHEEQVIHCDLKPANILFDAQGRAKVADFGIAHVSGEMLTRSWHTPLGFVAGTLPYMSPEQLDGVRDDPRVDVYALGAVLYRMLTGHTYLAFEQQETPRAQVENVSRIYHQVPSPPSQHLPSIPAWLDGVILRALRKAREERYHGIEAMRVALVQHPTEPTRVDSRDLAPTSLMPADRQAAAAIPAPDPQTPPGPGVQAIPARKKGAALPSWFWPAAGGIVVLLVVLGVTLGTVLPGRGGRPTEVSQPSQAGDTQTRSADGMIMVYVPAGEFLMGSEEADSEKPAHTVYLDGFWIDQTEVTNAQYHSCVEAGTCDAPIICDDGVPSYDDEDKANRPAVCVSWSQATSYCQWAGGRLPSEAEWEKAARGPDGRAFPWGEEDPTCDKANTSDATSTEHCVGHTTDVGSYPVGASPYGALDLAGNVWEWVADWYDDGYYADSPRDNPPGPDSGTYRVLRGGGWMFGGRDLRMAFRNYDPPEIRREIIGFRCAVSTGGDWGGEVVAGADATATLQVIVTPSPEPLVTTRPTEAKASVVMFVETPRTTVAATHTPVALAQTPTSGPLTAGSTQTRAKDEMMMVYVPAGEFGMGANENEDESPVHPVRVSAFWIDRTEVTNAQFGECVEAGACEAPTVCDLGDPDGDDPARADYPVTCTDWGMADAYCLWAGARLPTEAEWEKAARGPSGRLYPWGDDDPSCDRANSHNDREAAQCVGDVTKVGSYPSGASPYGALDMAGNAWEWVADWYGEGYYTLARATNPQGPETGDEKVLRGGAWYSLWTNIRTADRFHSYPEKRDKNFSFRCAVSAGE